MPRHKRNSGAGPSGKVTKQVNKPSVKEAVAHSVAVAHPVTGAGLVVLQTLGRFRHPLAPKEIAQRSGLPRRTVHYWLSKFLKCGYVERIGKPRSPGVLYALTREGRRALTSSRFSCCTVFTGQACTKPRMQNLQNSGSSHAKPAKLSLPLTVTLDGSAHGRLEVGVRAPYGPVRDYLRALGVRMPRKRVRSVVYYAKKGRVHCDMPVSPEALSIENENALLLMLNRVWLSLVTAAAVLSAVGVPRELVVATVAGVEGYFAGQ